MEKLLNQRNTIALVGVLTLWRLFLTHDLQLHPDEAYYWLWSRYLDISYFDHPPMVAYFIWLTTLVSKAEIGVRLSGLLVSLVSSVLIWRLSRQLYGSTTVAAGSVILFNVYPLTMLGLTVMTPDVPVFLFWALGVYLFWQIMFTRQAGIWYLLGLTFGMGLLSKYTAILMPLCIFAYLALSEDRYWLKTPHPYLALLLGFVCFAPVLYWNQMHNWASFTFQFKNGLTGQALSLAKVGEYIGGQLFITSPIVWVMGMYAALIGMVRKDKPTLLLVCTAVPVIAFFGMTSLRKAAAPNWPAFAYFSFSILATHYCMEGRSRVRRIMWSTSVLLSLSLSMLITLHARFNVIPLERFSNNMANADVTNYFYGWRELATELQKFPGHHYAVTPSHQLSAEIMYYTQERLPARTARMTRPSQFNQWSWTQPLQEGTDGLYVWSADDFIGHEGAFFADPSQSVAIPIHRDGKTVRTYHVIEGNPTVRPPFPGN